MTFWHEMPHRFRCGIRICQYNNGNADVHDIEEAHNLICEDDEVAYGDSVYVGIKERDIIKNGKNLSKVEYRIVRRPKSLP